MLIYSDDAERGCLSYTSCCKTKGKRYVLARAFIVVADKKIVFLEGKSIHATVDKRHGETLPTRAVLVPKSKSDRTAASLLGAQRNVTADQHVRLQEESAAAALLRRNIANRGSDTDAERGVGETVGVWGWVAENKIITATCKDEARLAALLRDEVGRPGCAHMPASCLNTVCAASLPLPAMCMTKSSGPSGLMAAGHRLIQKQKATKKTFAREIAGKVVNVAKEAAALTITLVASPAAGKSAVAALGALVSLGNVCVSLNENSNIHAVFDKALRDTVPNAPSMTSGNIRFVAASTATTLLAGAAATGVGVEAVTSAYAAASEVSKPVNEIGGMVKDPTAVMQQAVLDKLVAGVAEAVAMDASSEEHVPGLACARALVELGQACGNKVKGSRKAHLRQQLNAEIDEVLAAIHRHAIYSLMATEIAHTPDFRMRHNLVTERVSNWKHLSGKDLKDATARRVDQAISASCAKGDALARALKSLTTAAEARIKVMLAGQHTLNGTALAVR